MSGNRLSIRVKQAILIAFAAAAITIGGVALAQSSATFDLACRGTFSTAGAVSFLPNNRLILVDSLGQTAAGTSQGTFLGIKAGYVQPIGGPTAVTGAMGINGPLSPASSTSGAGPSLDTQGSRTIYMPLIQNFVRYVRPCTW